MSRENESVKEESDRMFKLAARLRLIIHAEGYLTFRDAVTQALFYAADDANSLDDKTVSQQFRYLANAIADAGINEPVFESEVYEELEDL